MNSLIGQQIAQYIIESALGNGRLGPVYKAKEANSTRRVALRIIDPSLVRDPAFQHRFWDVTETAVSLHHANIVPIYDVNFVQGTLYMAMSLHENCSLAVRIQTWATDNKRLALADALNLIAQLADAVDYGHSEGIAHLAISPQAVFVRQAPQGTGYLASALLSDLGMMSVLQPGRLVLGDVPTALLPYLSPEQVLGEPVDGRSDLYALGVLLYQLVTGQLPFAVTTPDEALHKHLHEYPESPQHYRNNLPENVAHIIKKMMAKEAAKRFQTGHDLAMALRAAVTHLGTNLMTSDLNVISLQKRTGKLNMPRLYIMHQYETTRIVPLDKHNIVIGRSRGSDIQLSDESLSRRHIHLQFNEGKLHVIDLNSTNGTFLNNARLPANTPFTWASRKKLKVGPYILHWE